GGGRSTRGARESVLFFGPEHGVAAPFRWGVKSGIVRRKLAIAEQLGSRALRTDAVAITCGYLSGVILVGLLAQLLLGAWRVDGVASLAIVYFLVREARAA